MFKLFGKKKKLPPITESITAPMIIESVSAESSSMQFLIGNAQHQGKRDYQEDSFGFSDTSFEAIETKGFLAVLADGMGGLSNGKEISQKTVSEMLAWFNAPETVCDDAQTLNNFVYSLNSNLCTMFDNSNGLKSGTTLVSVLIKKRMLYWLCVGDSRLYIKRNGKLYQVNEDHDYLNVLLEDVIDGNMNLAQAHGDPQKDSLAVCMGKSSLSATDYNQRGFMLRDDDVIMLCSDGIYNAVSQDELIQNITDNPMADAQRIKDLVLSKRVPHQDNNTLILIKYNAKG